jgi:iron complex outermembrane receptor protein
MSGKNHPPPEGGSHAARPPSRRTRAFATLACLVSPAFATETDPELYVLPPWTIAENASRPQPAARTDYFASTLGPAGVVTAADWSNRSVATLAEALRHTPGVMLQESFGGFEPPRLSIRGSGLDSAPTSRGVALLVDGLPLARADGSYHSGLFDPQLFPRIEIYRGTLHMALTPAVLGGVLNATSLEPSVAPVLALRAEAGDFGYRRAQLNATAVAPAQIAVSHQSTDGWREQSTQERTALQAAVHGRLGARSQLEASVYAATADYEVPGPLVLAEAFATPRSVFAAVRRDQPRRDSTLVRAAAQFKSSGPEGESACGFAALRFTDEFFQLQPNGVTDLTGTAFTGHATLGRRVTVGGLDHQLLVRAIGTTGADDVERALNQLAQRGPTFGAYRTRATTVALNVEDVVWLRPNLALGLGCTALTGEREIAGRAPSPTLQRTFSFDDLSPRAALLWSPGGRISFHAAVSRGIEPPVFDDLIVVQGTHPNLTLATRPLETQSAVTVEAGANGTAGPLDWSVTVYQAEWRNEILRLADAAGLPRGAVNASPTRHAGIEASLRWHILTGADRLTLTVTGTSGRFRFKDDPVYARNRLAGAPPHTGAAELRYEDRRGWYAAAESTWIDGPIPVDHAGRLTYGGHALFHLRAGWRVTPRLHVFTAVRNAFDRHHFASTAGVLDLARNPAATSIFLPGPGRAFTLGLEWKPF